MRALGPFVVAAALLGHTVATADPVQSSPPAPQQAEDSTQPAQPGQEAALTEVNLDEIVCRDSPPRTGSRIGGGRECHSQREWNQRQRDSQDALMRHQRMGFAGVTGGNGMGAGSR